MANPISHDILKDFYDAAMEVQRLEPWTFMEEDEIFAVRAAPDAEIHYVCAIGSAGISRSLVFYPGAKGWKTYLRLHSGEMPPEEAVQELNTLNLDFEPWSDLDPESRKRLKRMGLGPGDGDFLPAPVVYRPGREPVPPNAEQLKLLTAMVRVALPVFKKSGDEPGWLLDGPIEGHLFHTGPGNDAAHGEGEWLPPPEAPEPYAEPAPPDRLAIGRLRKQPLRPCSPWEILVGNSGAAVKEPDGAVFPLAAIFADSATGFIAGFALASAEEMPETLPHEVASAMEKQGARPEAFHVDREDVAVWLGPLAGALDIPVLRKDALPQAAVVFGAMREMLRRGPSGGGSKARKAKGRKPRR